MVVALLRWLPLVVWLGVVFGIGSTSALPMTPGDTLRLLTRKGIHVGEYAVLGICMYRALGFGGPFRLRRALLAVGLVVAIGALDEWHQTFLPYRAGRVTDVGIDLVGGTIGQIATWLGLRLSS